MNSIYLRRRRKVYVEAGRDQRPIAEVVTIQKNIEPLGFVLSAELMDRLGTLPKVKLSQFYDQLVDDLKAATGAHREFRPMYPDFPMQVMEATEAGLYFNAILHYLTNYVPDRPKSPRPELDEKPELRVIDLGSLDDYQAICTQMTGSRTALSPQDKEDLGNFVAEYGDDILPLIAAEMPIKENLAYIAAQLLRYTNIGDQVLTGRIKTATDVLRIAVALSDGDVSLAESTKFAKFPRSERVRLLAWLEMCGNLTEDMLRWKERWKRLGERLHPGEYRSQFPKACAAFDVLRNKVQFPTFRTHVEQAFVRGEAGKSLELLKTRPGELTRRLDHLLRSKVAAGEVLQSFTEVADHVATPVLLQAMTHFANRATPPELRTVFPKGEVAKVQAIQDIRPRLDPASTAEVARICERTLVSKFAKLPPLGKCYLDPALKNYLVPFSQRSASKSLRTLVRGSRIPLPNAQILRFFLWWKNGAGRTDIDLSAALFSSTFEMVDTLAYYNLRGYGGCHSGDIVDAPEGAAEFIDIDVEVLRAARARYVVMLLNSFTQQPYCDLPECFAGWMSRKKAGSGEIFEPRTVQDRVDLASNTRICIPAVFDVVAREVIWTDIALKNRPLWNNVHQNRSSISLMLRAMTSLVKTSLWTLFSLHIQARGERTADPASADTVFSTKVGITPFDLSRIAAEFL